MLRFRHVNTVTNGQVAGAGGGAIFWNVNVNTPAAGVLKIYNNTSAVAADLIASIDCSVVATLWYGIYCEKGIFFDLSVATPDVTIGYA